METAEQREQRIARLEESRAAKRGASIVAESDGPVEIAPGRGDLRYSSVPVGPSSPLLPSPWIPQATNGVRSVDGRNISFAEIFATQPWAAAAIQRMMTWSVRVPLKVYRRTGEDSRVRLRPDDHPLAAGVQQPWAGGFPAQLTMALLGPLLVHGNAVTELDDGGRSVLFEPFDWRSIKPVKITPNARTISGWKAYDEMGRVTRSVSADNAVHSAWWSPLGPEGVSPLSQLGVTVRIEDAAMRYQMAQLRNGARPPSAVTATTDFLGLEEEERTALFAQLREDITMLYAGPENQGKPALLPPGLDWKPIGHTSREAELIEQRYLSREEVAAVYQIPPPSLGDLRRATYSNIVELRQVAYSDGLGPPLAIIEQGLTATWQFLSGETDVYCEFDFAGVLRGDFLKEVNAIRLAIGSGLMTPNEGRAVQNREKSNEDGADRLWMPTNNLAPMGDPPQPNRAQRRAQQGPPGARDEEARGRATLFVAESWRSVLERERNSAELDGTPSELHEPDTTATHAEEAFA